MCLEFAWLSGRRSGFEEDLLKFYEKLRTNVPEGTEIYGVQEKRAIDISDMRVCGYYAVVRLPPPPSSGYSLAMFVLRWTDGPLSRPFVRIPQGGESERDFLLRSQAYCARKSPEHTFGVPIEIDAES